MPRGASTKVVSRRQRKKLAEESSEGTSGSQSNTPRRFSAAEVRKIFDEAQYTHKIDSSLERLSKIVADAQFFEVLEELKRNISIALSGDEKNPYTKNSLEFICRFLVREAKTPQDQKENSDNSQEELDELGMDGVGASQPQLPSWNLIDTIFQDIVSPHLLSLSATVRVNCCQLIRKILCEVNDMESSVYQTLHKRLKDRMSDKVPAVRAAAVKALYRFQEGEDDVVTSGFMFHLQNDPSPEMRQAVLLAIEPSKRSLVPIVERTRDVKDAVRKAAFHKITESISIRSLSIDQRLLVIKNGLEDRSPAVKRYVEKELMVTWLKAVDGNMIQLLEMMDIQSDPKTIDLMLNTFWKSFLDQKNGDKTQLHAYIDYFRYRFLDSRKLLLKEPLTSENCFVWRSLIVFCRENETKIQPLVKVGTQAPADAEIDQMLADLQIPESESQEAPGDNQELPSEDGSSPDSPVKGPTPPKRKKKNPGLNPAELDLIDLVLPELPHFCHFLRKYTSTVDQNEYSEIEEYNFEFMYGEFMKILLLMEIGDKAQEEMLESLIRDIIFLPRFCQKLSDAVNPLMKVVAQNLFKDPKALISFTESLTTRIHNELIDKDNEAHKQQEEAPIKPLTPAERRDLELKYAKAVVDIEILTDDIQRYLEDKSADGYQKASQAQETMDSLVKTREDLEKQLSIGDDLMVSAPSSQYPNEEPVTLSSSPEHLLKCLQVFCACVEFGNFSGEDTFIQSHLTNICVPGILSENIRIRCVAFKTIGICCLLNLDLLQKYFPVFIQVLHHDETQVKVVALKNVFDFLCEYGPKKIHAALMSLQDKTGETTDADATKSKDGAGDEATLSDEEQMTYESFVQNLSALLLTQMDPESEEELRRYAYEGITKMLILGNCPEFSSMKSVAHGIMEQTITS